jgi:hypothetical protein
MTPAEEATFIELWQQGASYKAIATAMRCPLGTVASRSAALAAQGKIQPRQRGGAKARQQALARQDGAEVSAGTPRVSKQVSTDTPGVSPRVSPDTQPVQYLPPGQDDMRPLLTDILLELRQLTGALATRVSTDTPQVPCDTPGVSSRVSTRTPLPAARGKSVRWNLHLSERLRDRIKALAAERGLQDSQMVEELLWTALSERRSTMP